MILDFYFKGKASASLEAKIQDWLSEDISRDEKDAVLKKIWDERVEYANKPDGYAYASLDAMRSRLGFTQPATAKRRTLSARRAVIGIAATLVLFLTVAGVLFLTKDKSSFDDHTVVLAQENQVSVSCEGKARRHVFLPDGSEAWVGPHSTITYPENFSTERTVILDGEAYFSVVKKDGKPFTVKGDGLDVTVLGTEFLVQTAEEKSVAEVTLAKGSVEVALPGKTVLMKPNEQLVFNKEDEGISIRRVNPEDIAPWLHVSLNFEHITLKEVLHRLSIYYGVDITADKRIPQHETIRVMFSEDTPLDEALLVIQRTFGTFDYIIEGNDVLLKKR